MEIFEYYTLNQHGTVRSIESTVNVFNYFGRISGLQIRMEKSTIYYAGISKNTTLGIEQQFEFAS